MDGSRSWSTLPPTERRKEKADLLSNQRGRPCQMPLNLTDPAADDVVGGCGGVNPAGWARGCGARRVGAGRGASKGCAVGLFLLWWVWLMENFFYHSR
jgi:hypothetical protein